MINKLFKIIGLMCLMVMSFIYTEKSAQVVRQKDPIMIQIEQNKDSFKEDKIDAKIDGKNIIPGFYGKEININETYENMKKYGLYNETMIKYKIIRPDNSIEDIYDKYIISGNTKKNGVSLIIIVKQGDDLGNIIDILTKTNTKVTFFMDASYILNNTDIISKLTQIGCEIEHLNYLEEEIVQINKELSKIDVIPKYCYVDNYNDNVLNVCKLYSMHTVKPMMLNNIVSNLKNQVNSGALISFKINKELYQSLEYIISYINQKGYNIMTLEEHLSENR